MTAPAVKTRALAALAVGCTTIVAAWALTIPDAQAQAQAGAAPDQYTASSTLATDKTARTGNAGDRVACGLITPGG